MRKHPKRPRDPNQLGKLIVDMATGEIPKDSVNDSDKNPHAVALGKLGGSKGGKARAKKLSAERRREIAKKAADSRWNPKKKK